MKRVCISLAAALALAVPSFAQVAQIGDKTYDTLAKAFAAVQDGQTISLLQDSETDTQIVVPAGKDITLDLNGHTYTFNPTGGNNFYAFYLQQVDVSDPAVSLTIEDTSAEQTGTIKAIGKADACVSATDAALTIHGGRFVQEGSFEYAVFATEGLVIDPAEGQTVVFPSGGVQLRRASISPYKEAGATITGGDFTGDVYYALYVGETSGGTTVNISGGTFKVGASGASVCFDVPAIANISGGDFSSGSLSITPDGEGTKLAVTGGIFKDPIPFADCGNGCLPVRDENGNYTVSTGNVAAIQQSDGSYVGYPNVAAAIAAAENGVTVTLIDKGTLTEACTIASGKAITLDLNGQDIDLTTDAAQFTIPANATLEVVGKGTLRNTTVNYSRGNRIFEVRGASADDGTKAILKVGADVTLECTCGIVVFGAADTPTAAYGVEVEMAGTINNKMYAITTNGQITTTEGNVPVIKVTGKINGPNAVGIYAAGYAKWDLAADIVADDALSIKSGDFTIAGGSYTSSAVYAVPPSANPGGNETTGAAISITTSDGYAQKTSVNITGGDFISKNGYALYEGIAKKADGTPAANASAVTIAISGNALFQGGDAVNTDIAITEAANKKVLSGGLFTKPVDLALCADGFFPAYVGYNSYGVQEGAPTAFPVVVSTEAGAFGCESLAQAFTASSSLGKVTFTLQQDIAGQAKQTLRNRNFDLTLDLNGHTLAFADGAYFDVTTGNLTVTGSGTLSGSTVAPIWVKGGSSSSAVNYTNVTVMGDVKVTGPNAVKLYATSFGRSSGANVTLKGNAVCETTGAGILVDSSITASDGTLSTVTLSENAKIVSDGVAIQGDGYATCSITGGTIQSQGDPITATNTAFSISGGTFSQAVPEAFCAPGYAPKQNADGTYSVVGWYETGVDTNDDGVADAWTIRNEGDLAAFRDKVNSTVTFAGCTVTLTADLDLSDMGTWIPIGEGNAGGASKNGGFFAGTFEGGNYLIANVTASETKVSEGSGLFGWVRGATIRDLNVSGWFSNTNGAAGLIGVVDAQGAYTTTTITNVHNVGGTVQGTARGSNAGGIIGEIRSGVVTITGCSNAAAVTASINHSDTAGVLCAGGIVGDANGASVTISDCSNTGAVTAYPDDEGNAAQTPVFAGGIVGRMGTGSIAAGNGDNMGTVSATGAGTAGQGAILGGVVAGTQPVLALALTEANAEAGRVALFTAAEVVPEGLTVTVAPAEGASAPAGTVLAVDDGTLYCNLLYLANRVAGESEGETFNAAAQEALLAAAGNTLYGTIAVTGTTAGDKALTTAQVNEVLACFEGEGLITASESEGVKTLVVAYDFGITGLRVTAEGDLVVTVAAQDAQAKPLAFAEGVTFALRNGDTPLEAAASTVADGVTTLTVLEAKLPAGNLELTISVAPAAEAETPAE